jgi:heme-degrading monooxygenase HmoA
MIARVIATQIDPEQVESTISVALDHLPAAKEQHGFRGFLLLADRDGGKVMTISLWEAPGDLQAVESRAASIRTSPAGALGVSPSEVDNYEVVISA